MSEPAWSDAPTALVRLREDGIIEVRCKDRAQDTAETIRAIFDTIERLLNGRGPSPVLAVLGNRLGVNAEGRAFLTSYHRIPLLCGKTAMIASSPVARVVGSIFVGLNRPQVPTKLFAGEAEALAWLREGR